MSEALVAVLIIVGSALTLGIVVLILLNLED